MHSTDKIECPICKKVCKSQGLTSHIRLSHPQENYLKLTRQHILPTKKGIKLVTITNMGNNDKLGCIDVHVHYSKDAVNKHFDDVVCGLNHMLKHRGYTIVPLNDWKTERINL